MAHGPVETALRLHMTEAEGAALTKLLDGRSLYRAEPREVFIVDLITAQFDALVEKTPNQLEKHWPPFAVQVATKIVDDALTTGLAISVFDGVETTIRNSTDREEILDAMGSTESDILTFRNLNSSKPSLIGSVTLIYANGPEVISDCTDNDAMQSLLAAAEELGETLREQV